ncbi:hypothetical protein [Luteolibacter sp. Populi]|uniref:hypothetical protein n=1 Tax=Luteolibacter sp. Populi TaxID=3230487 RepID=UPI0034674391
MSPQVPEAVPVPEPIEVAPPLVTLPPLPAKPRSNRIWIWLSTVAAAVLSVAAMLIENAMAQAPKDVSFTVGAGLGAMLFLILAALVVGALVAAILLAFKKPFRSSLGGAYSIAVFVLAGLVFSGKMFTSFMDRSREKREHETRQVDGMMEDVEKMLAETRGPDGLPKHTDFRLEAGELPKGASSMEKARHLMQTVVNDSIALQNEYIAALEKEGLLRLLLAERLAGDKDFSESRKIVAALRDTAKAYRERSLAVAKSVPQRLEKYDMSAGDKRDYLRGYENGGTRRVEETWKFELAIIEHMSRAIDHLEATRSDWNLENEMIVFTQDKDLETYNAIMADIEAETAAQTKIHEAAKEGLKEKVEKLK